MWEEGLMLRVPSSTCMHVREYREALRRVSLEMYRRESRFCWFVVGYLGENNEYYAVCSCRGARVQGMLLCDRHTPVLCWVVPSTQLFW